MSSSRPDSSDEFVGSLSKTRKRKSIGETAKREKKAAASPHLNRSKTLVVHPKEIEWPIASEELNSKLISKLKETLKNLKNPMGKPSLKEIRDIPKADRKQFRKKFRGEEAEKLGVGVSNYFEIRSALAIGVNCVSKQLEKDKLSAVLIDPDVDPPIMTKLLIPMARAKSVPIVAVKGLVLAISTVSDINCVALGLKKCCTAESSLLYPLLGIVKSCQSSLPQTLPENSNSISTAGYKSTKIRKLNS